MDSHQLEHVTGAIGLGIIALAFVGTVGAIVVERVHVTRRNHRAKQARIAARLAGRPLR